MLSLTEPLIQFRFLESLSNALGGHFSHAADTNRTSPRRQILQVGYRYGAGNGNLISTVRCTVRA